MPFIITRREPGLSPLFAVREDDGEVLWDPAKRNATPFSDDDAERIAAEINRFSSIEVQVEGLRLEAVAA